MHKISIVPLSVNKAWKGTRYKTDAYKWFEMELLMKLPNIKIPPYPRKLKLRLEFGFSSKLSDCSNPLKLVEDILCKKYNFNDRDVFRIEIDKVIVPKGKEYILFNISEI